MSTLVGIDTNENIIHTFCYHTQEPISDELSEQKIFLLRDAYLIRKIEASV